MRVTDLCDWQVKRALMCGYGDVGVSCVLAFRGLGAHRLSLLNVTPSFRCKRAWKGFQVSLLKRSLECGER